MLKRSDSTSSTGSYIDLSTTNNSIYKGRVLLAEGQDDPAAVFTEKLANIKKDIQTRAKAFNAPKGIKKLAELIEGWQKTESQTGTFSLYDQVGILIDFIENRKIGAPLPWFARFKWLAKWTKINRTPETQEYYLQLFSQLKNLYHQIDFYQSYASQIYDDDVPDLLKTVYNSSLSFLAPDKVLTELELKKTQKALAQVEFIYKEGAQLPRKFEALYEGAEKADLGFHPRGSQIVMFQKELEQFIALHQASRELHEAFFQRLNTNFPHPLSEKGHGYLKCQFRLVQELTLMVEFFNSIHAFEMALNHALTDSDQLRNKFANTVGLLNKHALNYFYQSFKYSNFLDKETLAKEVDDVCDTWKKEIGFLKLNEAQAKRCLDCLFELHNIFLHYKNFTKNKKIFWSFPFELANENRYRKWNFHFQTFQDKKAIDDIFQLTYEYYHALADTNRSHLIPHAVKMMSLLFENKTKIGGVTPQGKKVNVTWSELKYQQKKEVLQQKLPVFFRTEPSFMEREEFASKHYATLRTTLRQHGFIS